ncbi:MAG: WbqC family protein [Muribaculaceae bacterium]|nr:WbqC family protein [Muribaculaceae bacterium]
MDTIPYIPSAAWYACWLKARSLNMSDPEAIVFANRSVGSDGKDFARCRIAGNVSPTLLSVAVEGGAARLRAKGAARTARLSSHGNWPHVHLGAFEAAYGRSPYYQHIMPPIRQVLSHTPILLSDLNKRIHDVVSEFLDIPPSGIEIPSERCLEIADSINANLSVADALMRLGPEASLGLLSIAAPTLI